MDFIEFIPVKVIERICLLCKFNICLNTVVRPMWEKMAEKREREREGREGEKNDLAFGHWANPPVDLFRPGRRTKAYCCHTVAFMLAC